MIPKDGNIILLSGVVESGKTTLCLKLLDQFAKHGVDIKGVICPPVFDDGVKTGINLLNPATGEQQKLAVLRNGQTQGVFTDRWLFVENTLEWGNLILKSATPCDVLFIDELGPLEFERGGGWQNGLKAIDSREYALAIIVIRPSLIKSACQRWPNAEVMTVTRQNQDVILEQIMKKNVFFS